MINRRIEVKSGPGIKWDPILKITNKKRAGDMAQMVEHLPSNYKTLSPNLITTKNYKKKTQFY
jgi:hypothetical protein